MYEQTNLEQGGRCMVCRKTPTGKNNQGEPSQLHADHTHGLSSPRALLCRGCNVGLGMFNESPEVLRAAADYIESWKPAAWNEADLSV
jgi:hypothetical protein